MASIIRIKRSATSGNPTTLASGELAYSSLADNGSNGGDRLYFGHGTETGGNAANHEIVGGKFFTDQLDHAKGTLTASSALLVDANKKINELLVDNLTIDGNTITATDTNGDIFLEPNGTGSVVLNFNKIEDVGTPVDSADVATKGYVDSYNSAASIRIADGTDSDEINLASDTLLFSGGIGLTSSVTNNQVSIALDNTAVTAGSYGTATAIPAFTVDDQGRLTSAGTNAISTTLNLTGDSASSGSVALGSGTLAFKGMEGIDITTSGGIVTVGAEVATDTNLGVARFDATDFGNSNGAITVSASTLGSTNLNPGATVTDLAGLTQLDVDNVRVNGNVISTTDSANGYMWIDPGNNMEVTGKVIIRGDLQVDGTQTIINSTDLSITDKLVIVAQGSADSAAATGAGIQVDTAGASIKYNSSTAAWDFNRHVNLLTGNDFKIDGIGFDERIDDRMNNLLLAGEAIDLTYNDGAGTLTVTAEIASSSNLGVAKFNADYFTVDGAGDVIVHEVNGGTY
tara:strand:- start:12677 stop:14221 length:1545 start_codon:yes stop_codon:yes gene_type:complete